MNDLLPPRLPDPGASPSSGDVPALLAGARARRRRRAETALCVPLVAGLAFGGLHAVGGGNGPSEVRTVDPAAERDVHDVVRDIADAAGVSGPSVGGGGTGRGGAPAAGQAIRPETEPRRHHEPEPEPEQEPGGPYKEPELRYTTIEREIVADRPAEPCMYETSQEDNAVWCTRYLGPNEARSGQAIDMVVEYCPRSGTEGVMEFAGSQEVTILIFGRRTEWFAIERPTGGPHSLVLPLGSCVRWTIPWDGLSMDEAKPLAAGEYHLLIASLRQVDGKSPSSVFAGVGDRTLRIT